MQQKLPFYIIGGVVALVVLMQSLYRVDQTESALIVQLGKPIKVIEEPGLNVKIPFLQQVLTFDKRLLIYDSSPSLIVTKDKKNMMVDNYARWQIVDPLKFYQTVRNEPGAQSRLDDIVFSNLRQELGKHDLIDIVAKQRAELMATVTANSNTSSTEYGIRIADVRIKRADLPPENERAVYERMKAEREREAKRYRSEGEERALAIRATADKERTILLSEARRDAEKLRGAGDAAATRIYADAYERDPDFFEFLRTMEAYGDVFGEDDRFVVSPSSDFLKYMKSSR